MGASFVEPGAPIYTHKIHRDLRSFSGDCRLQINTLIMLDDSTEENGATWMASGSHRADAAPSRETFFKTAERATGRAGDVLVFDGNLWHCAGENASAKPRCIITPIFSRPFVKQALDYPAAFGPDFGDLVSEDLRQLLGYNALTPTSLREFYQPVEKRFYKSDQG
jgi:ectoine hydroxylase-related dioxygenase (phytanoyl-CoA dioxygenase family)